MISISEKASSKIKAMAATSGCDPNVRLSVVGGGCSGLTYDIDFEDAGSTEDKVYDSYGIKLFVDPMSLLYLEDTHIDYSESFAFSGFSFDNPKAQKSCGCGSSFTI
jgi:iron-sulfur cluster assembly accessory protein|tara:strand:- start:2118 stop:2438 length:321 start_codon:yes stop_codon:yes gene_type:complete